MYYNFDLLLGTINQEELCHLGLFYKDGTSDKSGGKDNGTDKNGGTDKLGSNQPYFFSKQPQPISDDLEIENELYNKDLINDLPHSHTVKVK